MPLTVEALERMMAEQERRLQASINARIDLSLSAAELKAKKKGEIDDKKRTAKAWFDDAHRESLRAAYKNHGLTEEEAQVALYESAQPAGPTTLLQQPYRRGNFKAEELGTFDGSPEKLGFFLSRIDGFWETSSDPAWREPLFNTLPMCLRDGAAEWWQSCMRSEPFRLNKDWPTLKNEMKQAFGLDDEDAQSLADRRRWKVGSEEIGTYFHTKHRLLLEAYPEKSEKNLVSAIIKGLPDDFKMSIRTNLSGSPTLSALLVELRNYASKYRRAGGQSRSSQQPNAPSTRPGKSNSPSSSRKGASLEDTFDPKRYWKEDGKDKYRVPGTEEVITRTRPCDYDGDCGGPHFRFMHTWLQAQKRKKKEENKQKSSSTTKFIEGYPVDGSDSPNDEDFTMLDTDDEQDSLGHSHFIDLSPTVSPSSSSSYSSELSSKN